MTDNFEREPGLNPCPFCGGSEIMLVIGEECGSYRLHCRNDACDVEVATYSVETEADAIAAWNRRTPAAVEAEVVEKCAKLAEQWEGTDCSGDYIARTVAEDIRALTSSDREGKG